MEHIMTADEIHRLKTVEIELLDELDRVCRKNHLAYFLVGGTALGAVRHGGFIPWDDDIDVVMPRNDLDRLEQIANEEFDAKYFFQSDMTDPNYPLMAAKLRKNGTVFEETAIQKTKSHKGIFIDIFPLDYVSIKDQDMLTKRLSKVSILTTIICEQCGYHYGAKWHTRIFAQILKVVGTRRLKEIRKALMTHDNETETEYVTIIASNYGWRKQLLPASVYFPPAEIEFEGKPYLVHNDVKAYLSNLFGDYMQLPPEDKRVTRHPICRIDFGV